MDDISKHRKSDVGYTLSDALKEYRGTLRLSQQQLADLTFELAEQGMVTHGIVQQHISRIEKGDLPQEHTLRVIATTIAEAYNRDGWDTTSDAILKQLRNAKATKVRAGDVSAEAAKLDAMIAPMPAHWKRIAWKILFGALQGLIAGVDDELAETRRQKRDITSHDNTGEDE